MSDELFIGVYLDEDVHVLVGELLSRRGYRVLTARDAGQLRKMVSEQLEHAASLNMAIVTHNRMDFEELHRQYIVANRNHAGIIISVRRRPYEMADRLFRLLDTVTAAEMQNQLLYI